MSIGPTTTNIFEHNIQINDTMLSSNCTHIRIRDTNDYDLNVRQFLESLEKQFKIDFTTFPGWKELVQRLHVASTDCRRKIQAAMLRKVQIVEKLHMQYTRPSPFELTDGMCRTRRKWLQIEADLKKSKVSLDPAIIVTSLSYPSEVQVEVCEDEEILEAPNLHPNTENISNVSPELIIESSKHNAEMQADLLPESHLPAIICTNPHKILSPLESNFSGLSYKSTLDEIAEHEEEKGKIDIHHLKLTTSVVATPSTIFIAKDSLKQQILKFTVTNCTGNYMHIRFIGFTDTTNFKRAKLVPAIPMRLYPGIPVTYKFIFNINTQENFTSSLYFKVGSVVYDNQPAESLYVPIITSFTIKRSVSVTDTVEIPPVYAWHMFRDNKYSSGNIRIVVDDPFHYHLHIRKRVMDLAAVPGSVISLEASGPKIQNPSIKSDSIVARKPDKKMSAKKIASSVITETTQPDHEKISYLDDITTIATDIIMMATDTFMLDATYLYLEPYSKINIPVYFCKMERIGCHQYYYDFEFVDPETEKVIFTVTSKIFAEILPHPIQIKPVILDMSQSPVSHGYCEDHFVVYNNHKLYPCNAKIKLTTKMKKMFYVEPMETLIPTLGSVTFFVKFCSRDFLSVKPSEDLVHFTFKIVVNGYKTVYENIPRIFYEIIAPCAVEFKKVYNEKYFKDVED
ncbi:unnamed protein product [Chrysodeixis includens]|uniref:Uncharacterized protein n=1 Tax=Chrysodeixis includens TaxID=689277 RepID=A0A9N8PZ81_CHRIL|nr:unnamed protein product [Chrysodeixis includens]